MAEDKPIELDILLALKDVEKLEKGFEALKAVAAPFADAVDRAKTALESLGDKEALLAKLLAAGAKVRNTSAKATTDAEKATSKAKKATEEQAAATEAATEATQEAVKGWKALTAEEYRAAAAAKAAGGSLANLVRVGAQWYEVADELVPEFKLLGQTVNASMATSTKSATLLTRAMGELSDEVKALPGASEALGALGAKSADQLKRETANAGRSLAMLMDEQKAAYEAAAESSNKMLGSIRDMIAEHVPFGRALAGIFDELEKVAKAEEEAKQEGDGLVEGLKETAEAASTTGGKYEALTKVIGSMKSAKGLAIIVAGGLAAALTSTASAAVGAAQEHAALIKEVQDASRATGLSTEAFSRYRTMFRRVNVELSEGAELFSELNDKATDAREGGQSQIETFQRLGISVEQLNGPLSSSEALLETLAERYKEATRSGRDLKERQAELKSIQELLGDELYKKLLPAFADGAAGIARFREEADRTGQTLKTEAVEGVNKYHEAVRALEQQWDTLTTRISSSVGEVILPALTSMARSTNYAMDVATGKVDALYEAGTRVTGLEEELADTTRAMQALAQTPGVGADPASVRKLQEYGQLLQTLGTQLDTAKAKQEELSRAAQKTSGHGVERAPLFVGPAVDTEAIARAEEKAKREEEKAAEAAKRAAEKALEARKQALKDLQDVEVSSARETDDALEAIQRKRAERLNEVEQNQHKAGAAGARIAARARLAIEEAYQKDLSELTQKQVDAWAAMYKEEAQFTVDGERSISREQKQAREEALSRIAQLRNQVINLHKSETAAVEEEQAAQLAALQTALDASLLSQQEYEDGVTAARALGTAEREKLDQKELESRTSLAKEGADLLAQVWGDISDQYEQELQTRSEAVERHEALQKEVTTRLERTALEEKISAERAKLAEIRKAALIAHRVAQATALASIGIDTAMGAQKAYAQNPLPSPVGLISAGLVTGAGVLAAAKVAMEPAPKFAVGGLVRGASHAAGGVMAELEGGEYVLQKRAVDALGVGLVDALNRGMSLPTAQAAPLNVQLTARIGEKDIAVTMARAIAGSNEAKNILRGIA